MKDPYIDRDAYAYVDRLNGAVPVSLGASCKPNAAMALTAGGAQPFGLWSFPGLRAKILDVLPATPEDDSRPARSSWFAEWAALQVAAALDCLVLADASVHAGERIQSMTAPYGDCSQLSGGSMVPRTEALEATVVPDMTLYVCLRNIESYVDTLWPVDRLIAELPQNDVQKLADEKFVTAGKLHPVLYTGLHGVQVAVDFARTRGVDQEHSNALTSLLHAMVGERGTLRNCHRIVLRPGDMLLVDNRRCLHGVDKAERPDDLTSYHDRRWVLRLHLQRSDRRAGIAE